LAVGVNERDPLSVLELREVPLPEPLPGQVRVRMAATTVNMHDLWTLRGVGVDPNALPKILGCDIVGWDDPVPENRDRRHGRVCKTL
jgi:NADPH:quinone reductase-like Zn-dependent oxidoreductase